MKSLISLFCLVFSGLSFADSHRGNVFDWVESGMSAGFPQTHIINEQLKTEATHLGFKGREDYLSHMANLKGEVTDVVGFLKTHNPELWAEISESLKHSDKVLLSVFIDEAILKCDVCQEQKELLAEKNYFGMTGYQLVISK